MKKAPQFHYQQQKTPVSRQDKLFKDKLTSHFDSQYKLASEAICSDCGAHYKAGHWSWGEASESAESITCPACRRIAEGAAAGVVDVPPAIFFDHENEIRHLIANTESNERNEHPLERLIDIEKRMDSVQIKTTGKHLANRIAHALSRTYGGHLEVWHDDSHPAIRIQWLR